MIGSQEVLDALKNIGLNLYERKIYLALLAKGVATAGVVSEIAKVPRSRSYDVLESLADKGFVVAQSSKPIGWTR
jgi:sugar-specific transcriptional regulator TrmB